MQGGGGARPGEEVYTEEPSNIGRVLRLCTPMCNAVTSSNKIGALNA